MEITLKRRWFTDKSTIGELEAGDFSCFVLEDVVREKKIYGETAIPAGRYEIVVTPSNRFKRRLPLLLNVPGYEGIRIHPGNTAEDTEGCLLPGRIRGINTVGNSIPAFNELLFIIQSVLDAGDKVFIEITNEG